MCVCCLGVWVVSVAGGRGKKEGEVGNGHVKCQCRPAGVQIKQTIIQSSKQSIGSIFEQIPVTVPPNPSRSQLFLSLSFSACLSLSLSFSSCLYLSVYSSVPSSSRRLPLAVFLSLFLRYAMVGTLERRLGPCQERCKGVRCRVRRVPESRWARVVLEQVEIGISNKVPIAQHKVIYVC